LLRVHCPPSENCRSREDHDHQLGLVIDLSGNGWDTYRLAGADDGVWVLGEDDGLLRYLSTRFGGVVLVVEADADDLGGPDYGSVQPCLP
jgi:hypothetical protein